MRLRRCRRDPWRCLPNRRSFPRRPGSPRQPGDAARPFPGRARDRTARSPYGHAARAAFATPRGPVSEDASPPGSDIVRSSLDTSATVGLRSPLSTVPDGIAASRFAALRP